MSLVIQRGGGGGGGATYTPPELVGGRLSLQAGVAIPTFDLIGISTLRWVPLGGRTALYTGAAWEIFTDASDVTLALSGLTADKQYDVFLKDNAGTRELSLVIWAGSGQALTGATNATPVVITAASHGLADGDEVYIEGVRGPTGDTDPYKHVAPNGAYTVASAGATFALSGSVGSFAYLRGGYFSARSAAGLLALQDGVLVLASDHTKRYVGTIRTTATTTTEDSRVKRFVWNAYNQVQLPLEKRDYGDAVVNNVADGESGYALWAVGGAGSSRVEFIQGLAGMLTELNVRCGVNGAPVGHVPIQIGIDATPRREFTTASNVFATGGTGHTQVSTTNGRLRLQNGYHVVDIMYAEIGSVNCTLLQGSTTGTIWG